MIAQFALRLICGMSLMWGLMPRRQVTSGFFRIQMLVVMGLGVLVAMSQAMDAQSAIREAGSTPLAAMLPTPWTAGLPGAFVACLGFFGSALWTLERRTGAERIGFGLLAASAVCLWIPFDRSNYDLFVNDNVVKVSERTVTSACHPLIGFASEFVNASVLGSAVVGMLLGHWYLTTPTMSIEPLKRLNLFLGVASVLRFVVSATIVFLLWSGVFDSVERVQSLAAVPKTWLGLRWLAGVFGPMVVGLMVWRILKYRNTQAATGVLFVGVILVFIGDMTAALLLRQTGLPL